MASVRTVNNFFERSEMIREIESECLRAEKNEKVNLIELKEKLAKLTEKLQKTPIFSSHSSDLQDKELAVLQTRVNALSKTNSSAWVKPVLFYTACAISGIAIVWMGSSLFSSSTPMPPQPPVPAPPQPPVPAPPQPTAPNYNELTQKTNAGDCSALATLIMSWNEKIYSTPDTERTQLIASYKANSNYNNLVKQGSKGDSTAMEDLDICWQWVEDKVPETTQLSIEEAYNAARISNYRVLKQEAIDGSSTSMDALTSSWKQPDILKLYREITSIQNAFALKIRFQVEQGDPQALNVLEAKWRDGLIWNSDSEKSELRERCYNAILKKVQSGESEAWKILTTAWYEGKTSVGIESPHRPTAILSAYYKHHPEKWGQAQQGDLKTMIGLRWLWMLRDPPPPPKEAQTKIVTAFEIAFKQNYQDLMQKTKSGDKTAMDAMKSIWFEYKQVLGPDTVFYRNSFSTIFSSISITEDDIKSIRAAYNLARVPNYLALQKKASEGDDTAISTLKTKWEDGTLEVLEAEKEQIQKIAEARSGDWDAMDALKSYWKENQTGHNIIDVENEKSSIETDYQAALPKKYQEVIEAAKNGQEAARWKLRRYWNGLSISNKHTVDREDYYSAVIPDYKNLKKNMLEGSSFAKGTLVNPNYNVFLSQADSSSLIEGYWTAQVSKTRKGDAAAKCSVDSEKNTGRFNAATLASIYEDFLEKSGKNRTGK